MRDYIIEYFSLNCVDFVGMYILNGGLRQLKMYVTDIILVGSLPRIENPLLNVNLRRLYSEYNVNYFSIGNIFYTSFPVTSIVLTL